MLLAKFIFKMDQAEIRYANLSRYQRLHFHRCHHKNNRLVLEASLQMILQIPSPALFGSITVMRLAETPTTEALPCRLYAITHRTARYWRRLI
jgi:hypothetical protein